MKRTETNTTKVVVWANAAKAWYSSADGKAEVKKAVEEAKQTTTELSKTRRIDRDLLHEPVTM